MKKTQIGVLVYHEADAKKNHAFIEQLISEADKVSIQLTLIYTEDIALGIHSQKPFISHPTIDFTRVDFAIVRAIHPLLSHQLELLGIRCFNSSRVADICNHKAKTHQFVAQLQIPMANTLFLSDRMFSNYNDELFTFPLILKEVDGRSGQQVERVESRYEIEEILNNRPGKQFILQEMIKPAGKDVRVFVMGKQIIGAVLRESATSFKANYSLGGSASAYKLNDMQKQYVQTISEHLQADFVGIDFLLDDKGNCYFNEVEDIVGSRTLYATTDLNVARLYITYISEQLS